MYEHFSTIAQNYRELRTTDLEPISYIREKLQQLPKIEAADFGCGDGRYSLKLCQYLGDKLYLCCIDNNKEMLEQLNEYLTQHEIKHFQIKQTLAEELNLQDESLDCVFTFNAIHLFIISEFLKEVARVLKEDGYLFIYTRLRNQNMRSIWGNYFPLFNRKETRLYELEELKIILEEILNLEIQHIEFFKYQRVSCLDGLIEQAQHHHYSTFHLYTNGEFEKSLNKFKQNLQQNYRDVNNISWTAGNVLFVIRKRISQLLSAA